jgi:hypothetical protein
MEVGREFTEHAEYKTDSVLCLGAFGTLTFGH